MLGCCARRQLCTAASIGPLALDPLPKLTTSTAYEQLRANWAENVTYKHETLASPVDVTELQEVVAGAAAVRPVGSAHSFNLLSDTGEGAGTTLLSVACMTNVLDLNVDEMTVDIEAGVTYGRLCAYLQARGAALANLPSLPQPTVVGAVATGTHGTGLGLGAMGTQVREMDVVLGDGSVRTFTRGDPDFDVAVVHMGALGVISRLRLDIEPTYDIAQRYYTNVPVDEFISGVDRWMVSCRSPSAFVNFGKGTADLWTRDLLPDDDDDARQAVLAKAEEPPEFGGQLQDPAHPGVPFFESGWLVNGTWSGSWNDVLMFFSKNGRDTPMPNCAIHTEYFVPVSHAQAALQAANDVSKTWPGWSSWDESTLDPATAVGPLCSEIRVMAGDNFALSPSRGEAHLSIHFTLPRATGNALALVQIKELEAALEPFSARPHWGKLFTTPAAKLKELYGTGMDDFLQLRSSVDPTDKFLNDHLRYHLGC